MTATDSKQYWSQRSRELAERGFSISMILRDPKNKDLLISLDQEKLKEAVAKTGIIVNLYRESPKSQEYLFSESLSKNLLKIYKAQKECLIEHEEELKKFIDSEFEFIESSNTEIQVGPEEQICIGSLVDNDLDNVENNNIVVVEEENKINNVEHSSSSNLFSLLSSSFYKASSSISNILYGEIITDEVKYITDQLKFAIANRQKFKPAQLRDEIVSLFSCDTLKKFERIKTEKGIILVPEQLFHDCNRIKKITFNGAIVSYLGKQHLALDAKNELTKLNLIGNGEIHPKEWILKYLIMKLGKALFKKVGRILNQAQFGDVIEFIIQKGVDKKILANKLETQFAASGKRQYFEIDYHPEKDFLSITAKIIYKNQIVGTEELAENYWGLRREITVSAKELVQSDNPPSLKVKERITDLLDDRKEVIALVDSMIE